jgi:hypothetical protein
MSFGPHSEEHRFLVNQWADFVLHRIEDKFYELKEEYYQLSPDKRDKYSAYKNGYDELCFEDYDLHNEVFNTERFYHTEDECIENVNSSKEMLYILQYTQMKVNEEDVNELFDTGDTVDIMNKFIYFIARDMLCNQTPYIFGIICDFMDIYEEYRLERKIAAAIICKRTDGFDGNILANILSFMN